MTTEKKILKQCKSCPWKVDCVPARDIPGYKREMHKKLSKTIKSGFESIIPGNREVMACHYSQPGKEIYCAGWLDNQLGVGNNLGIRMAVMRGVMPVPEVHGDQHDRFEDTLRKPKRRKKDERRNVRR